MDIDFHSGSPYEAWGLSDLPCGRGSQFQHDILITLKSSHYHREPGLLSTLKKAFSPHTLYVYNDR